MKNTCSAWVEHRGRLPSAGALLTLLLAAGCAADAVRERAATLPTGHYEGPIGYQGTDLQASLDLRETTPGHLEADLRFPEADGLGFLTENLRYSAPQLVLDQSSGPSGIHVTAVQEGDFLRGVFTLDSIRADFVWVRRGRAAVRPYQEKPLPARPGQAASALKLLLPQDTAARHAAVAFFTDDAHQATAVTRADQLARQGFITTVVTVAPGAVPDSATLREVVAVLTALRRAPAVDTSRIGLWSSGPAASIVAPGAGLAEPKAAFVVLENVPLASAADARPLQVLGRQRIRTLALYAAADTALDARQSARLLRSAVGSSGTVRTFPKATAGFLLPGELSADGQWTWPRPAPGYVEAVKEWLK